jgi:hypothetical protein
MAPVAGIDFPTMGKLSSIKGRKELPDIRPIIEHYASIFDPGMSREVIDIKRQKPVIFPDPDTECRHDALPK